MKPRTFTAKDVHDHPGDLYREVDRKGQALINHDRYPDRIFVVTSRPRKSWLSELHDEQQAGGSA